MELLAEEFVGLARGYGVLSTNKQLIAGWDADISIGCSGYCKRRNGARSLKWSLSGQLKTPI